MKTGVKPSAEFCRFLDVSKFCR